MPNKNSAVLMGHVGRDPEFRTTQTGKSVCTFTLATNPPKREGQPDPPAEWHRVVCWGKTAEIAAESLKKGDGCYVEGRITYRKWEDKNGQERETTEIVAWMTAKIAPHPQDRRGGATAREYPPPPESEIPF